MSLFALSSFVFMFFIPLVIDLLYFNYLENVAIVNEKYEYLFSLIFYSMLIMIPCMMIGFIGLVGAFHIAKKLVWQEGINMSVDFFGGIKDNWKHALVNGFISGVLLFGLVVGSSALLIFIPDKAVLCGIGIGALILLFLFIGMSIALFFPQDDYYQNRFIDTFKNSFRFLGLLNWKVLVIFLLSTGGLVALCAINMITMIVGFVLFAVLNGIVIVLYTLISHSAFDKYINAEHYPDMVGKGLYKVEKVDENENKEA